ncbi:NAD(P)-dependent oxidoreductase [Tessaracoccus sp. MC1756]|uniref:NAD(P)-dependent oxidoreductase n=1 Tax=Tessaracoccus sp. MC1756 TaxID=2760311 RepID=UPI001C7295B3|nr:NAD(P)-dependent oxidoreductase [Tessaracoccus sp. MC1756]
MSELGFDVVTLQDERQRPDHDPRTFHAVVCNSYFAHHRLADHSRLEFVQLLSTGWDRFPRAEADRRGVQSFNARGVYNIPLAEWVITRIFEYFKSSRVHYENQKRGKWEKLRAQPEIYGKTATVVGLGQLAATLAPRLSALGMRLFGVSRRGPFVMPGFDKVLNQEDIFRVLPETDVLISCLPLESSTRDFFGAQIFRSLKESSLFLNVSRGGVVDEAALVDALRSGSLSGAALDVFEHEPLPDSSPFWELQNVIVTPHDAFESDRNHERLSCMLMANLRHYVASSSR